MSLFASIRPARRVVRALPLALAVLATPLVLHAQTDPAGGDIESSEYTFAGEVSVDGSLVRSGPSESDYAVLKLDKGARLTVVGMRFDWLKVVPPEGSFCLVPIAFVERSGDGTVGKVGSNPATVRIGSALTQQKH